MSSGSSSDYPYIRAWGRHLGSYAYYIEVDLSRARKDNAPADAIYWNPRSDGTREWHTVQDIAPTARAGFVLSCRLAGVEPPTWAPPTTGAA